MPEESRAISASQVWKFEIIPHTGWTTLLVPRHSRLLSIAEIGRELFVWAKVPAGTASDWETELRGEEKRVAFVATGEDMPEPHPGCRRVQLAGSPLIVERASFDSPLVYHVFEERPCR